MCKFCDQNPVKVDSELCLVCSPVSALDDFYLRHRINHPQLEFLQKSQSSRCPLCFVKISYNPWTGDCAVDRDAKSDLLRGVVCISCKNELDIATRRRFHSGFWEYAYSSVELAPPNRKQLPINCVIQGDALLEMPKLMSESVDMIYVDPPFGTGKRQTLASKRAGTTVSKMSYEDKFADYIEDFLHPILNESKRLLKSTGTLYLHLDRRYSHYAKVVLDGVFGKENFINHIVWSYNYGGRGKNCFPRKHDDILVYSKVPGCHKFRWDAIDKIPYKAPDLQKDPIRAAMGQVPTDVWEMTIVPTNSKEKTGYPTQKPLKLIERAIRASTDPGDVVLDFCCGSGSTLVAAHRTGRGWVGIEKSDQAITVIEKRLIDLSVPYSIIK